MEKKELDKIALDYGKSHGLSTVSFAFEDEAGLIYHLSDDSIIGRKTGLPHFIRVSLSGEIFNDFSANERYDFLAKTIQAAKAREQ